MKIVNISFIVISIFLLCILTFSIRQLKQTIEQGQQNILSHQKEVQKKTGTKLELEIKIIGDEK